MGSRRGWGEDGIFFEHTGLCRDSDRHRNCPGRWRGVVSLGHGPDGKRIRRKVSGKTRAVVQDRLKALHNDLDSGVKASPNYTVRRAAQDWLAEGLDGRSAKTVKKNENVLAPILTAIGSRRLRELTADDVRQALGTMAARYSTAAVAMGHNALTRAIRHAEGRDLVGRNVAALADTPKGQAGRPSKSLTLAQAAALLPGIQRGPSPDGTAPGTRGPSTSGIPDARLHCSEPDDWAADRGDASPALGSCRPEGQSRDRAANATACLGVALRPRSWRHEDGEVAAQPGTAGRLPWRPSRINWNSRRMNAARRVPSGEDRRSRVHDSHRRCSRCRERPEDVPGDLPVGPGRRALDAEGAKAQFRIAHVRAGNGHRRDCSPSGPQQLKDD